MKQLLLLPFVLAVMLVRGQTMHPFPTDNAVWTTFNCIYFSPTGYPDYIKFAAWGDTTFLGKHYTKIYKQVRTVTDGPFELANAAYYGCIREFKGKIYFIRSGTYAIRTLYNFNVNKGDYVTIYSPDLCGDESVTKRVWDVDSLTINGVKRRALYFGQDFSDHFPEYWIEGIGSSFGLMSAFSQCSDNSFSLACFRDTATGVIYMNDIVPINWTYCGFQPEPNCSKSTVIETDGFSKAPLVMQEEKEKPAAQLYPNPVTSMLNIQPANKQSISRVIISDGSGRIMNTRNGNGLPQMSINTASLPPGLYHVKIIFTNSATVVYKIKKQ
jgi:Secretion system C-terminal sorting domain